MLPDLGFAYDTSMIRRKGYLSQLHVKSSVDLGVLNPKLTEIASKLSLISHIPFSVAAVELWPDQTQSNKPANFSLQRKIGEPPSSDRYWSQAGMPTDKHLQLLEEIETLLR
jgi:hypothetical protein